MLAAILLSPARQGSASLQHTSFALPFFQTVEKCRCPVIHKPPIPACGNRHSWKSQLCFFLLCCQQRCLCFFFITISISFSGNCINATGFSSRLFCWTSSARAITFAPSRLIIVPLTWIFFLDFIGMSIYPGQLMSLFVFVLFIPQMWSGKPSDILYLCSNSKPCENCLVLSFLIVSHWGLVQTNLSRFMGLHWK